MRQGGSIVRTGRDRKPPRAAQVVWPSLGQCDTPSLPPRRAPAPLPLPPCCGSPVLLSLNFTHFRGDFPISVSICANLWPIPVSVAAGRAVFLVREGGTCVKPSQTQSNQEMLPHASKWQKMAISGRDIGVRPRAIPLSRRSLLSTKASAAVDGEGANRAQSCIIVVFFWFKPSFIPHLACPSRILPSPAIVNDGRQACCCVCVLLFMGYFPGDS